MRQTNSWANIDRAKKLLNRKPEIDFDTGMKDMLNWYLENKDWVSKLEI